MRIVFVPAAYLIKDINKFKELGAQSVIFNLAKCLACKGHEVYIVCRFERPPKTPSEMPNGINIVNIEVCKYLDKIPGNLITSYIFSKKIEKTIKLLNPDIVNFHDRFSGFFLLNINSRKVYTIHTPDACEFYKPFAIKSNLLNIFFFQAKKFFEMTLIKKCDAIVVLNEKMRNYVSKIEPRKINLIPNGIEINKYFNLKKGKKILYCGRLTDVKGIEILIKAFETVHKDYDFTLEIIGSGDKESTLKKDVYNKNLNKIVTFIPWVTKEELRNYLAKGCIFVLPSYFESFSIILIEAMASNCLVIASDIPGAQDCILTGYNGYLFKRGNVEDLTLSLKYCLDNYRNLENVRNKAKLTIKEKYTIEDISNKYETLFRYCIFNSKR